MAPTEQLVDRWFGELFNEGELAVADELLASDVSYHGPTSLSPRDVRTAEDVKRYVRVYRDAFPDIEYTVDHVFRDGDEICARWTAEGTHESDLFGIEPSAQDEDGRESFSVEGVNVFLVEDGRIAEVWSEWDTLKMAQELDVVPTVELL